MLGELHSLNECGEMTETFIEASNLDNPRAWIICCRHRSASPMV